MITAVIVQARVSSTRLPGKVLLKLGGRTVLEEVLRRCRAIPGADIVVCAIPESPADDALIAPAERAGTFVVRGSADDVLSRYRKAADFVGADVALRITSDCPLIDPVLCGDVLALRASRGVDYAANNMPPSYPHGLDCEAFTVAALRRADEAAKEPYEREHVTPWLRNHASVSRSALSGPGGAVVAQRWTLDFPEDYAFIRALYDKLAQDSMDWRDVMATIEENPALNSINAIHRVRGA